MKEFEIATKITTPLMLAALALCVLFGLLKAVAAVKKPNAALQSITRWGFVLALVLGVLANISYLVIASFGREVRFSGTVHDEKGQPVALAVVDLGGKKGRAITDDYGEFELNVPAGRTAQQDQLTVSAPDFVARVLPVKGPRPKEQIDVQLSHPIFTGDDFAKLEPTAWVRHYLGNPQVVLTVNFSNPEARRITLENIFLTLTSPLGKTVLITLDGTAIGNGPLMQAVLPALPLEKAQNWMLNCSFCNADSGLAAELSKAYAEVPSLREVPTPADAVYSKKLADELRAFAKTRMIWAAGQWQGRMSWSVEGKPYEHTFRFTLSEADVSRMSAITKYYEAGFGVYPSLCYAPVEEADPTAVITLQK